VKIHRGCRLAAFSYDPEDDLDPGILHLDLYGEDYMGHIALYRTADQAARITPTLQRWVDEDTELVIVTAANMTRVWEASKYTSDAAVEGEASQ
jgi:hypothetical protein